MADKTIPLFLGVEDTLVIETAVKATGGQAVRRPTLKDYCGRVDKVISQGLGNFYVVRGYMLHPQADPAQMLKSKSCVTADPDGDLVKLLEYAAGKGIYTMTIYTNMTRKVVSALKRRCGKYYLGNNMGEITMFAVPPGRKDMRRAAETYVKRLRGLVKKAWQTGQPHVTCTITNLFAQYCMEAGMDIPTAEIFTLPCVDVQFALLRGAMRGFRRQMFGGWLATGWFSGSNRDPKKPKQWQLALNSGYLHGANFMIQESGHWGLYEFRDTEDENHPLPKTYRQIQKRFHRFANANPRLGNGPEVRVGIIQGRFDGYSGLRGNIWGQPDWTADGHEDSWELLKVFYPGSWRINSHLELLDNRYARFSGTPYGLVDIVPAVTPAGVLARYSSLLMIGWNTMDDKQYRALMEYVRSGGHLVMWASQLNASANHEDLDLNHKFYRHGDFSDLFGVSMRIPIRKERIRSWRHKTTYLNTIKWIRRGRYNFPVGKIYYNNWPHGGVESKLYKGVRVLAIRDEGFPFVTEYKLGKGLATLVHTYSPQGHGNFREFAEDVFHAVGRREQPDFRVEGSPLVSYAVYGAGRDRKLYALNTSVSESAQASVIGLAKGPRKFCLKPAELVCLDNR